MKLLVKILLGFTIIIGALVIAIPLVFSVDDLIDPATEHVERLTGRTLTVSGEKRFALFPSLSIELNGISFSNAVGGSREHMLQLEQLDIHIPWTTLLSGELSVERFVLRNPQILLEVNSDGVANWDLFGPETATGEQNPESASGLPAGFDLSLGEVAIYGGTLVYLDASTETRFDLSDLELSIALPSLNQTLQLSGSVTHLNQAMELEVTVTTPNAALSGDAFDLALTLDSALLNAGFSGQIGSNTETVTGDLFLKGKSVKQLAAWQGIELEASAEAFNAFKLDGTINWVNDTLSVQPLSAELDALQLTGTAALTLSDTPVVVANVELGELDLNPYLPAPVVDEVDATAPGQPVVWDEAAVDLSALDALNADITLSTTGLIARDITLGRSALRAQLQSSRLSLVLSDFQAYSGSGQGSISVDATRTPYRINTQFELRDVAAQPLLTDAVGFDKLSGTGMLSWALQTSGNSQADFISALDGNLGFSFSNGAIRGANLAALVRSANSLISGDFSGINLDKNFDSAASTDFSELSGSLVFADGVGTNSDLSMASPLVRVSGAGTIDLPRTRIDYLAKTRLVSSIEGQAASDNGKGVAIPVQIKGQFHDLKIKPRVDDAVKDKTIDKLKKKFFGGFNQ